MSAFRQVVLAFSRSSRPQSSLAVLAEKSSERDRKILVRNVCSKVRQIRRAARTASELMLCVATIGMHFGWRERLKNFSSPVGSLSPTVAKWWYSSQRKELDGNSCSGFASITGTRFSTAVSKSSFIMTPIAFARPGFIPIGKLRAQRGGGRRLAVRAVKAAGYAFIGAQRRALRLTDEAVG